MNNTLLPAVIIIGVILYRMYKSYSIKSEDYPRVDETRLMAWRSAKLKSDMFLVLGILSPALVIYIEFKTEFIQKLTKSFFASSDSGVWFWVLFLGLPTLILLGISAFFGEKAKKGKPEGLD